MMRNRKRQECWDRTDGRCFWCGTQLLSDEEDIVARSKERRSMVVSYLIPPSRGGAISPKTKWQLAFFVMPRRAQRPCLNIGNGCWHKVRRRVTSVACFLSGIGFRLVHRLRILPLDTAAPLGGLTNEVLRNRGPGSVERAARSPYSAALRPALPNRRSM